MNDTQQLIAKVSKVAAEAANARWGSMVCMFGEDLLRPAPTFPLAHALRDPYAPGQRPGPGEFHAHTFCMFAMDSQTAFRDAELNIDKALWMMEAQVRESLRGKLGFGDVAPIPPAIDFQEGDRVQAVILKGAVGVIRHTFTALEGTSTVRVDFDLLLKKAAGMDCATGAASRMVAKIAAEVIAARECSVHANPVQLLVDDSRIDDLPVAMIVGIGHKGAAAVRARVQEVLDEINAEDSGEQCGD